MAVEGPTSRKKSGMDDEENQDGSPTQITKPHPVSGTWPSFRHGSPGVGEPCARASLPKVRDDDRH